MGPANKPRPAVFLDRDGTLNHDCGFVHRVEDLRLIHNVVRGLRALAALGFELVVTTNQSGIARGMFGPEDMHRFNRALVERLAAEGIALRAIYFCPFHPTAGVGAYRQDSPLRKPNPGMIELAAAEHRLELTTSYAIGDKKSDVLAGSRAGCRTVLVGTGASGGDEPELSAQADFVAADLLDAARWIARDLGRASDVPRIADIHYLSRLAVEQPIAGVARGRER